jgi:hypothetical protein
MTDQDRRVAGELPTPCSAYPTAPWHAQGLAWAGLFRADLPAVLPPGAGTLLGTRWRVVALVRYLEGSTLRYDELLVGTPARVGLWPGVYVEHLYVNSEASLWGGRCIWGLPKELAEFVWHADHCHVRDTRGDIALLRVDRRRAWMPRLPAPVIGFGRREGRWAVLPAPVVARLGGAGLRLLEWSERFPYRLGERPVVAIAAKPLSRATFPAPRLRA